MTHTKIENDNESRTQPTILILHASVGSGHKSAAIAIEEAFRQMQKESPDATIPGYPAYTMGDLTIETLDILDFGRVVIDGGSLASQFTGSFRPVYDVTWRYLLTGRVVWGGGTAWSHAMYPSFTHYVKEKKPLAIVCTHICGANVAVGARFSSKQTFPIICVPTDYESEGFWPHHSSDLFCVANETMAETLRARKVEERRIAITGIPTKACFGTKYDRDEVRKLHNLPTDKHLVLIMAGATLSAPYMLFRNILDDAFPYFNVFSDSFHFVFLAGNDADYARNLKYRNEALGLRNVSVLDYRKDVAALMSASDFAICKAGGLTVTECLCTSLPMIIVGKTYGQEKVNRRFLTAMGAAIHVTTYRELLEALHKIEDNPETLESLKSNARYLRRPQAGSAVAQKTLEQIQLAKTRQPKRPHLVSLHWGNSPAHER